ncbi:MAG: hypothetical protein ACKV2T_35300 [Kofleriaceae bacterium]
MKNWLVIVMALGLAACGGESAEERICSAANGCGAIASADFDVCIAELGNVDAARALEECADCLEANTCGQIAAGACASTCPSIGGSGGGSNGPIGGVPDSTRLRDVDPSDLADLCHEGADVNPRRVVDCVIDGREISVSAGVDRARCGSLSIPAACNATVGQFRECNEWTGAQSDSQLCALDFPAACQALANC